MTTPTKNKATRTKGADLVPDLSKHKAGLIQKHFYWIGALPSSPSEALYVAGVDFPKMTEKVTGFGKDTQRIPGIGHVRELTADQVARIRERLPRVVIRFDGAPPEGIGGPGSQLQSIMPHERTDAEGRTVLVPPPRRRGHPITIKTDAEMKKARAAGTPARGYSQMPYDEPAANHIFAVLCADQNQPQANAFYPESLAVTGLDWPGEQQE